MKRNLICNLIIFIFIFTAFSPGYALGDDLTQYLNEDPKIMIAQDRRMPVFNAGEKVCLYIPIENAGKGPAQDMVVSINVGDVENFPFEMDKMSLSKHINFFSGDHRSLVGFDLKVPANVKPKTYPITVNVTYSTGSGGGGSESATIYVKIVNDYKQPELKLTGVDFEGDRLLSGKTAIIKLNIKNDSDLPVNDVELHLSGFTSNGINLDKWPDTQYIREIKAKELKPVEYKIYIDPDMETGTHTLDLSMKYKDEYNKEYTKEHKVYLPVAGKGDHDDLTPRIIIDNYYYNGEYAVAGNTFPLTMSFLNTSDNKEVKNIKISLNSEGGIFSPIGSSNSFYIAAIDPDNRVEHTIMLKPKVDAEHQTYNITAHLDYQDEDGNKYSEDETISIPVIQDIKLITSEVVLPQEIFAGNPAGISIDFYNTGRAVIRNLMIHTEGDFEVKDGALYVGNIEPGKDDYYDVTIIPQKEGSLEGKIVFEYDDAIGEHYQIEQPFKLEVMPQEEPIPPEMPLEMQEPESSIFKIWMIPTGVVILAAAVFIIVKRRRKKKEEVDFDE